MDWCGPHTSGVLRIWTEQVSLDLLASLGGIGMVTSSMLTLLVRHTSLLFSASILFGL